MAEEIPLRSVCEAALDLQRFCEAEAWRFCFIGGLAVLAWALPRTTVDADITLLTGFGNEEQFVDKLMSRYDGRLEDARSFALQYRVLLLRSKFGIGLDIGLGALPFEESSIERSRVVEVVKGCELRVCCAEDLIVHKAFASRDQDWADVDSILMVQGAKLNTSLILQELQPLVELKEDKEIVPRLRKLLQKRGIQPAPP